MFTITALVLTVATVAPMAALVARHGLPRFLGLGLALDAAGSLLGLAAGLVDDLLDSI